MVKPRLRIGKKSFLYLRSPPQPFRAPPPSFHLGRNPASSETSEQPVEETKVSVAMKRAEGVSSFPITISREQNFVHKYHHRLIQRNEFLRAIGFVFGFEVIVRSLG